MKESMKKKAEKGRRKKQEKEQEKEGEMKDFRERFILLIFYDSDKKQEKKGANEGTINLTTEIGKVGERQEWQGFERRGELPFMFDNYIWNIMLMFWREQLEMALMIN